MSTDLKYSRHMIKIRTRGMRWVKKHCEYRVVDGPIGRFTMPDRVGILWTPCMNREICGKVFTVVAVRKDFIDIEGTDFSIPRWLLTEKSQRRLSK